MHSSIFQPTRQPVHPSIPVFNVWHLLCTTHVLPLFLRSCFSSASHFLFFFPLPQVAQVLQHQLHSNSTSQHQRRSNFTSPTAVTAIQWWCVGRQSPSTPHKSSSGAKGATQHLPPGATPSTPPPSLTKPILNTVQL